MLDFYTFPCTTKLVLSNLDFYQADHALFNCYNYVHKWNHEFENNHTVASFYMDLRKAFDSVSHCKLIRTLGGSNYDSL